MKTIYILLLLVMILWGVNVSAIKILVSNIDPIVLTAFRIFTAGIAVLVIAYFMKIFRLPTRKEMLIIFYIAIFNVIAHHIFMALGLTYTSGVNTGLILGMGPLTTMMLSIIFLGQRITFLRIFGFVLGFIGVVATTLSGSNGVTSISIGDFMAFLGMLTQAYSFILISKLKPDFDPRLLTGYMLVLGSLFIFMISLLTDSRISQITKLIDWKLGLIFLFSALLCTALGHMVYNFAIKKAGPAESAIFINLNTFFALAGAALFLNETITAFHIIGLMLIVCGVLTGSGALEYMIKKKNSRRAL